MARNLASLEIQRDQITHQAAVSQAPAFWAALHLCDGRPSLTRLGESSGAEQLVGQLDCEAQRGRRLIEDEHSIMPGFAEPAAIAAG
jgi:hypothetical protein